MRAANAQPLRDQSRRLEAMAVFHRKISSDLNFEQNSVGDGENGMCDIVTDP